LDGDSFIAVAASVYCPYADFEVLQDALPERDVTGALYSDEQRDLAWLYLTASGANPGDFALTLYTLANDGEPRYPYTGIALLRPALVAACADSDDLLDVLRAQTALGRVGGEVIASDWADCTQPGQLERLNNTGNKP
ncbi:MAG TPA: nucleotidyltransferase family protein, partial [Burkholderiaceae bacterium]